jgi:hypothetical protein
MIKQIRQELNNFRYSPYFKWLLFGLLALYVGILSNLIVVRLNGGMPFSGTEGDIGGPVLITSMNKVYIPISEATRLSFLSDVFVFGDRLFSIGDFLMFLGSFGVLAIGVIYIAKKYAEEKRHAVHAG